MRFRTAIALLGTVLTTSCGGNAMLVRVDDAGAGDTCPNGGLVVHTGADDNGNGVLDDSEIEDTSAVCNGEDGATTLIDTDDEPPGANCSHGGTVVQTGTDDDGDGVLDEDEVDATSYVCEARASLVSTDVEAPGSNCAAGGVRVRTGVDVDEDGILDDAEVLQTDYLCNGSDADEIATRTDPEDPGANCAEGGHAVHTGVDDDGDGLLADEEIDHTAYVCNGTAGATALVTTTAEPPGPSCATGGFAIASGLDTNGNDALDAGEVTSTAYVCHGALASYVSYVERILESPPTPNRQMGGRSMAADADTLVVSTEATGAFSPPSFVYERSGGGTWSLVATLQPPYEADNVGEQLAVHGDVIAISARLNDQEAADRGAVYIYERTGGLWQFKQKLLPADSTVLQFGSEIALGDGLLAATTTTKVVVFRRNATSGIWEKFQTFTPPAPPHGIAVEGETIVIGSFISATNTGTAFVYDRIPATGLWAFTQELLPTFALVGQQTSTQYGLALSTAPNRIAISDRGDDLHGTNAGAVYVFDLVVGQGWQQRGTLTPDEATPDFSFGTGLALAGDVIVAGGNADQFGGYGGGVYLYRYDDITGWTEQQRILSPDRQVSELFGRVLAIAGDQLVVGAGSHDEPSAPAAGACHVYDLTLP